MGHTGVGMVYSAAKTVRNHHDLSSSLAFFVERKLQVSEGVISGSASTIGFNKGHVSSGRED